MQPKHTTDFLDSDDLYSSPENTLIMLDRTYASEFEIGFTIIAVWLRNPGWCE